MRRHALMICLSFVMVGTSVPTPRVGASQTGTPTTYSPRLLPAPLPRPTGDPDDAARLLAAHVVTGGEAVVPALLTTLQMSGIGVVGLDGSSLLPIPAEGQGIAIDEGDLWAPVDMQGTATAPLLGFADGLAGVFTVATGDLGIPNRPDLAAAAMLRDLQTMAIGDDSSQRFFARFLGSLSSLHPLYAVDLLGMDPAAPLGGLRVSVLQIGLIAYRIAADVEAEAVSRTAVARVGDFAPQPLAIQTPSSLPCTLTPTESFIVEQASQASTRSFRILLSHLASQGTEWASSAKAAHAAPRVVMAYVELIVAFALYDVTFVMEGGGPLVRTKGTAIDGQAKRILAVDEGVIVVGTDFGEVVALESASGAEVWRYDAEDSVVGQPAVAGNTVVVTSLQGILVGLDVATGSERWIHEMGFESESAPVVDDGLAFAAFGRLLIAVG